jgi:hypothetical protein
MTEPPLKNNGEERIQLETAPWLLAEFSSTNRIVVRSTGIAKKIICIRVIQM